MVAAIDGDADHALRWLKSRATNALRRLGLADRRVRIWACGGSARPLETLPAIGNATAYVEAHPHAKEFA